MGNWSIEHLPTDNIVHVTVSGRMTETEVLKHVVDALAVAGWARSAKFLVDHQKMLPLVTMARVQQLPSVFNELGLGAGHRLAVVISPTHPQRKEYECFEAASRETGLHVRLFSEEAPARSWLLA